jgi:hypothetical protein
MTTEPAKAKVIEMPPHRSCPACGARLRPATQAEIQADLRSADPQARQFAERSAQGRRNWVPPEQLPEWEKLEAETQCPSWQYRCDSCGHRLLWSRDRHDPVI